ncbi:MAG: tRNA (5-methylaminomethyl-2-thiouridine)(34)-methyltransferase MnmD [Bacteroidia bacterium]|nr:tRNA (5-methylaminomethyl-2-thiouridine)(34)-methyltransferase MnmD [Bacteroidia bacterium]
MKDPNLPQTGRQVIETLDGSPSLWWGEIGEHYHSTQGAFQESQHIYIQLGMQALPDPGQGVSIFEMGFGTGLNAMLAYMEGLKTGKTIDFTTLELFPLDEQEVQKLDLPGRIGRPDLGEVFLNMHRGPWEERFQVAPGFHLTKLKADLREFSPAKEAYHCVFFDAFSPGSQPDLWSEAIFEKMYAALLPGGNLTTYCAKGVVKRAMISAGFRVEGLPGPPGKREVRRAWK